MTEQYEITFILDEGAKSDKIENILKAEGSVLKPTLDLGVKQFVYPIKKKTAGNYFAIEFTAEKAKLQEIETELKAEKTLIRYLIVKELRKPVDLPPRVKTDKADSKEIKDDGKTAPTEPAEIIEEVKSMPVQEKVAEVADEPGVITPEVEETSASTDETPDEQKAEEPAADESEVKEKKTEEKPAKKPRAKAEKVSADELDKKLEELVKE